MGGACSTYGGEEVCIQVWWENLRERDRLEYLVIDERIILKGMFKNFMHMNPCIVSQTLKCSNKMTLFVQYFISCKQLYMFRVKHSPIIRSSNKLFISDSSTTTAGRILSVTTRCCNYNLFKLLMMGECFTRNM
jgi:hypothetical protein